MRLSDGFPLDLSPDGKWVLAVDVIWGSKLQLVPTGAGLSRSLDPPLASVVTASFLPGSRGAIITGLDSAHVPRAYEVDLTTGGMTPAAPSLKGIARAVASPDGKRFVAATMQGTYIVNVIGGEATLIPGLTPNDVPIAWPNEAGALYISPKNESPRSIYLFDLTTRHRQLVRRLVPADPSGVMATDSVFMTPDAQTIAYSTVRSESSSLFVVEKK